MGVCGYRGDIAIVRRVDGGDIGFNMGDTEFFNTVFTQPGYLYVDLLSEFNTIHDGARPMETQP